MAEVVLSDAAESWIRDAEPDARDQVLNRLDRAAEFPDMILEYYRGSDRRKLRAGDYRAVIDYRQHEEPEVLYVERIGHRDGFYD